MNRGFLISRLRDTPLDVLTEKALRHLQPLFVRPASRRFLSALDSRLRKTPCELIIDHGFGGGCAITRRDLIDACLNTNRAVLIIGPTPMSGYWRLEVQEPGVQHRSVASLEAIGELTHSARLERVTYNTAVGFRQPELLLDAVLGLVSNHRAALDIMVHDYFGICPSHFLLDKNDRFCGIPDTFATCAHCLPENGNTAKREYREYSLTEWRRLWMRILSRADRILAFSTSSIDLLRRAYPGLKSDSIHLVDQRVRALPPIGQTRRLAEPELNIGVVGRLGHHKGAAVVLALAEQIESLRMSAAITVFGRLEMRCRSKVVSQTGLYRRDELPRLIAEKGIDVFLFPSICPETFSHTLHELIGLEQPIACFDLGAQKSLVNDYPAGLILSSQEPAAMLAELQHFKKALAMRETTTP